MRWDPVSVGHSRVTNAPRPRLARLHSSPTGRCVRHSVASPALPGPPRRQPACSATHRAGQLGVKLSAVAAGRGVDGQAAQLSLAVVQRVDQQELLRVHAVVQRQPARGGGAGRGKGEVEGEGQRQLLGLAGCSKAWCSA